MAGFTGADGNLEKFLIYVLRRVHIPPPAGEPQMRKIYSVRQTFRKYYVILDRAAMSARMSHTRFTAEVASAPAVDEESCFKAKMFAENF